MADEGEPRAVTRARQAGAVLQGLVLGFCLVLAGMQLAALAGDVAPFRYQGF